MTASNSEHEYAVAVGANLRKVRKALKLSLQRVEELSRGRWSAVLIGSYERGDRHATIGRINELCTWYRVPITDVLPVTQTDVPARIEWLTAQLVEAWRSIAPATEEAAESVPA